MLAVNSLFIAQNVPQWTPKNFTLLSVFTNPLSLVPSSKLWVLLFWLHITHKRSELSKIFFLKLQMSPSFLSLEILTSSCNSIRLFLLTCELRNKFSDRGKRGKLLWGWKYLCRERKSLYWKHRRGQGWKSWGSWEVERLGWGVQKKWWKNAKNFQLFQKETPRSKEKELLFDFLRWLCPKPTGQNYFVKNFHGAVGGRISIRVNKAFASWPGNSNNIASKGKCFSILNSPLKTSLLKHNLSVN